MSAQPISPAELIVNADGSIYHLGLRPEQISDVIITVGDPERVPRISRYFDTIELQVHRREIVTHTGTYRGRRLSVVSTGMGTDNIDIVLNELDALVNIDLEKRVVKEQLRKLRIIRVGTSGSLQPDLPVGSLLASAGAFGFDSLLSYYRQEPFASEDIWCQELQQHMGLPFLPYFAPASGKLLQHFASDLDHGYTVTCPGFYGPQGRKLRLQPYNEQFVQQLSAFRSAHIRATNLEMETAGYYGIGRLLGHEVLSLNAVLANRLSGAFASDPDGVVEKLIQLTLERAVTLPA